MHRLGVGPDGQCVLCRRADRERAARRLGWFAVLGLAAASGTLLLAWPAPLVVVSTSPARPGIETSVVAELAPAPAATPEIQVSAPAPSVTESPSTPVAAPSAVTLDETKLTLAEAEKAALAEAPQPASQEAIDAALRSTRIEMFAAEWCGVCRRARAFLVANGLRYRERDIDRDPAARDELRRRSGKTAVPTFEIEGELLPAGFSEAELTRAMVASVERRLGVTGIRALARSSTP